MKTLKEKIQDICDNNMVMGVGGEFVSITGINAILKVIREALPKEIDIDKFYKKHKENMDIDWIMTEKLLIKKNQWLSDIKEKLK